MFVLRKINCFRGKDTFFITKYFRRSLSEAHFCICFRYTETEIIFENEYYIDFERYAVII